MHSDVKRPEAAQRVLDVVVTIDGPAGAGKSSVARRVAERASLRYLDSGALYRALTVAALAHGVDLSDPEAVGRVLEAEALTLRDSPFGALSVHAGGKPIAPEALRSAEVSAAVSAVSAIGLVRDRLLILQQEALAEGGIVAEGRDMGTVVWPSAEVKVFLTAAPNERVRRRSRQHGDREDAAGLHRRDQLDRGRAIAPLVAAPDAVHIDSTVLSLDEVSELVLQKVEAARVRHRRTWAAHGASAS